MAIGTPTQIGTGTDTTNNATVTVTTSSAGTAGSLIVAIAWARLASTLTTTFSGGGLTWTTVVDGNFSANNGVCSIGFAQDVSGLANGSSITATFSLSATRKALSLYTVTGLDKSSTPYDSAVTATNGGSAGAPTITGAGATSIGDEIIFAGFKHNTPTNPTTATPPSGWTELDDFMVGASTFMDPYSAYRIITASETPTCAPTFTDTSANWNAAMAAFKIASGSVATTFDEITAEPLTTGPWSDGPVMFYEARDELIFAPVFSQPRPQPVIVSPVVKDSQVW